MRNNNDTERHVQYWWIRATDPEDGKPYLIAGGNSEDEARQKGFEMLAGVDFQVIKLRTRNLQRASSLAKGERLEKTKSLHEAARHMGHEKSVERLRKRRLGRSPARTATPKTTTAW